MNGMVLPETERTRNDVIDLLNDAAQKLVVVENEHGRQELRAQLDPESIWAETRTVDNPYFGRMVLELKKLESMADEAYEHMSPERATVISAQIKRICYNYRLSIDAKSSETRMDKHNAKSNLLDKLLRQRSERVLSIEDNMKGSILDGFKGKQTKDAVED